MKVDQKRQRVLEHRKPGGAGSSSQAHLREPDSASQFVEGKEESRRSLERQSMWALSGRRISERSATVLVDIMSEKVFRPTRPARAAEGAYR